MRLTLHILFVVLICGHFLHAGEYFDAFLLSANHPRVQSLGLSTVASGQSMGHALNNPAGLSSGDRRYISILYDQFSALSNNIQLEAKYPLNQDYKIGLTIVHSSVNDLFVRPNLLSLTPGARRDSVLTSSLSSGQIIEYREDALFLTLAREYNFEINLGWKFFKIPVRLPVGASLKYLDKVLVDNRGLGAGIDIGMQFMFSLREMKSVMANTEFGIGVFLSDILNTPVYWTTEHQDAIKRGLVIGYTIIQSFPRYASDVTISTARQDRYVDVRQYGLELNINDQFYLRGGHDGFTPSFGLGIGLKKFIIDYSFSQHELANMQKIGINYHF